MATTITATYTQDHEDWTVSVTETGDTGEGKTLTGRAPGIIAARDRADQLVEKMDTSGKVTVVHLLNGSAFEFTQMYMNARLTRPAAPAPEPEAGSEEPTRIAPPAGQLAPAPAPEDPAREAQAKIQAAIDSPEGTGVFTDIGEVLGAQRRAEHPVAQADKAARA